MDSIKLWARKGEAVRQAIELGEIAHLETASEELTDEFLLFAIGSGLFEFISIKPLAATGSDAPGSYTYCISSKKFSSVFSINSLHRSSSMKKPLRGGKKRTAVWASPHEERGSDDVVAPPVCDYRVVPHRWVVFDRCNPSGVGADAGHDTTARVRGSARAGDGSVVYV